MAGKFSLLGRGIDHLKRIARHHPDTSSPSVQMGELAGPAKRLAGELPEDGPMGLGMELLVSRGIQGRGQHISDRLQGHIDALGPLLPMRHLTKALENGHTEAFKAMLRNKEMMTQTDLKALMTSTINGPGGPNPDALRTLIDHSRLHSIGMPSHDDLTHHLRGAALVDDRQKAFELCDILRQSGAYTAALREVNPATGARYMDRFPLLRSMVEADNPTPQLPQGRVLTPRPGHP